MMNNRYRLMNTFYGFESARTYATIIKATLSGKYNIKGIIIVACAVFYIPINHVPIVEGPNSLLTTDIIVYIIHIR